jgi:hypothetical protein
MYSGGALSRVSSLLGVEIVPMCLVAFSSHFCFLLSIAGFYFMI